jgi:hypothetical protein
MFLIAVPSIIFSIYSSNYGIFPEKTSVFPTPLGLVPEAFTVSANILPMMVLIKLKKKIRKKMSSKMMHSNYLQSLPSDSLKTILFDLTVQNVLRYCETNLQGNKLCKSNTFWKEYIFHNYDLDQLYKKYESFLAELGITDHENIINSKLGRLVEVTEGIDELATIEPEFLAAALYLENSKYIKRLQLYKNIPEYTSEFIISPYDSIRNHVRKDQFIYGDQISVVNRHNRIQVKILTNDFVVDNIKNLKNIKGDTMIKNIVINENPLLYYINSAIVIR